MDHQILQSKYLKPWVLKSIKKWIKKVRVHQYSRHDDCDTKAEKKMNLPFEVIGSGCNRIVYDIGNGLVLKIAKSVYGIENINTEANIYRTAPFEVKKHLAKVKEYGDGWIIMKHIKKRVPITFLNTEKVLRLKAMFELEGIIARDLISTNESTDMSNIRFKKDDIVVIDYGEFKKLKANEPKRSFLRNVKIRHA